MHNRASSRHWPRTTGSGYSLDQRFYCDDEVFAADMREIVARKWIVAGHVDRVRRKGDYFLFKIGEESIIIVRSDENDHQRLLQRVPASRLGDLHRAARTCGAPHLPLSRLVLRLDGALLAARLMPADFSKEENGLHRCHVRVFHGFIFINLSE